MRKAYIRHSLLAVGLIAAIIPVACLSQGRVVARVNDQPITEQDLRRELIARQGARLLLQMIDTLLITQAARKANVSITDHELDLKLQQAIGRIGSERDFEAYLKRQGRSKEEYRQELRAEALLERLALADHPLEDADLRQYYDRHQAEFRHGEQVRFRLMLFAEKANADTVAQALQDPQADFAGLARAFSEDPATKDQGGDTGFVERDAYAKPISDRAFAMKPGETSTVFEAPDGWAIIQVLEKRPPSVEPFEKVRDTLRARVQVEQLDVACRDWLARARAGAQINIHDEFLAAHVRKLIEADAPFEPSNLAPDIPMAPR